MDLGDRHREIYERAPVGLSLLDPAGRIVDANARMARVLGAERSAIVGQRLHAWLRESDAAVLDAHLQAVFAIDAPCGWYVVLRERGGSVHVECTRLDASICVCVLSDVPGPEHTVRELQESELRFRRVADHLADAVLLSGRDPLRVSYVSPAFETIFGRPVSDAYERVQEWLDWVHPDDRARVEEAYGRFFAGAPFDEEYRIRRPDGELRRVRARIFPIPGDGESTRRDVSLVQDVTTERALEENLRHAQKMEAVGALASGVAHDFNNVLQAMLGCINIARREDTEPARALRFLDRAAEAARRGGQLAGQLMAFTRKQDPHPEVIEVDALIGGLAELLGRLVTEQVALRIETGAPGLAIVADAVQIEQILLNLAANARDAMPEGGTLTIATDGVTPDASHGLDPGVRHVRVRVTDTGKGMDETTRARIFEPFFTTKEVGKGTGLGLATVFAVTRQLGGHVDVQSEPGVGTTFTLWFPCSERAMTDIGADPRAAVRFRGTALLVEDDPLVRITVLRYLEDLGLRVLDAPDPGAALYLLEQHAGAIDLLVTDIVMPWMRGPALAARVRERHPDVRVLFMSATPEQLWESADGMQEWPLLRKPFGLEELASTLRTLLPPEPADVPVEVSEPASVLLPAASGARTILLVEDEPTSRVAIAELLELEGYALLVAEGVAAAQRAMAAHAGAVDLLLSDLNLPDGNGLQFAEVVRASHPGVRLILMSGALHPPEGATAFVHKPIDLDHLLDLVQRTLAEAEVDRADRATRS